MSQFIELPDFGTESNHQVPDSSVSSTYSKGSPHGDGHAQHEMGPNQSRQRTVTDDLCVRRELQRDYQENLEDEYINKSENKAHS